MDNQERVIDLRVVCWQMLRKWVWIILGAVIGAVLLGGVGAVKTSKQQNPVSKKQAMKALRDGMTPQAIGEVDKMKAIASKIDKSNHYIAESPYMQVDPYNEHVTYLEYLIQNKEDITVIKKMYQKYIEDGALGSDIISEQNEFKNVKYLNQMISFVDADKKDAKTGNANQVEIINQNKRNSLFSIKVMGTSTKKSEALAEVVCKAIQQYEKKVSEKYASHTMELVSKNITVIVDKDLLSEQTELETQLADLQLQYSDLTDKLEDNQKTLLTYEISNQTNQEEEMTQPAQKAGFTINKKYVAVGFVMGGFLVVMCLGVWVILTDKIVSDRQIADLGLVKVFGTFGKKKGTKLEQKVLGDAGSDSEKQLESICVNVKLYCDKEGIQTLYLAGNQWDENASLMVKKIAEKIIEMGLTCQTIKDVIDDPAQLEKIGNGKNILLLTESGKESVSAVEKTIIQLERLGNTIAGAVLLQ